MMANAVRGRAAGPFREAEEDGDRRTVPAPLAGEEAPGVPAGGRSGEQPAEERASRRRGRALELHPVAHGGQGGDAHAGGGAAPVSTGGPAGGTRRRGASCGGNGHGV